MSEIDSVQMSPEFGFGSSFTPSLKTVLSVRKQLMLQFPKGHFGLTKYNNIGTLNEFVYEHRENNTYHS